MTNYNQQTEDTLLNWGKSARLMPENSEVLKTQVLREFKTNFVPKNKSFKIPWMSLALAGTAVITLIISTNPNTKTNFAPTESLSSVQNNTDGQNTEPVKAVDINSIKGEPVAKAPLQKLSMPAIVQQTAPTPQLGPTAQSSPTSPSATVTTAPTQDSSQYKAIASTGITEPELSNVYIKQVAPITDNREFTKTIYSASVDTTAVVETTEHIKTIIHGFGGRIDSSQAQNNFGSISFAVPASQFEAFKKELAGVVGERFINENIQTQNFLPQKKGLETQEQTVNGTISDLQNSQNQLNSNHNKIIGSYKNQINTAQNQLNSLQNEYIYTMSRAYQVYQQEQALALQIQDLQTRINQENSNFQAQTNYIVTEIQNAQQNLQALGSQDKQLVDDVATVNGTISLSYINILQLINYYITLKYWIAFLLIIGALTTYQIQRRKSSLLVP